MSGKICPVMTKAELDGPVRFVNCVGSRCTLWVASHRDYTRGMCGLIATPLKAGAGHLDPASPPSSYARIAPRSKE